MFWNSPESTACLVTVAAEKFEMSTHGNGSNYVHVECTAAESETLLQEAQFPGLR